MINKKVTESMFNELMERKKQFLFLKACETFIRNVNYPDQSPQKKMIDRLKKKA